MKTKICCKCKQEKPLSEFRQYKKYRYPYCKMCNKIYQQNWNNLNRNKIKVQRRIRDARYRKRNSYKRLEYFNKYPWLKHFFPARSRCKKGGNYYPQIKFNMTREDFKELWFKDKAYLMKRPSIDRINNNRYYTLENCRFIELSENSRNGGLIGGKIKSLRKILASRKNLMTARKVRKENIGG